MLQDYHQKQKSRADNLDLQRKSLQESLARLTDNEVNRTFQTIFKVFNFYTYFTRVR